MELGGYLGQVVGGFEARWRDTASSVQTASHCSFLSKEEPGGHEGTASVGGIREQLAEGHRSTNHPARATMGQWLRTVQWKRCIWKII